MKCFCTSYNKTMFLFEADLTFSNKFLFLREFSIHLWKKTFGKKGTFWYFFTKLIDSLHGVLKKKKVSFDLFGFFF